MTRTPGEYVYHAGYLPRGLESVKSKGLIPSQDGYSGPGVYFAYEPDEGFYHVDAADATMFRVRWSDLVNRFGVYPQKPDGIQRDDNEIIVPGAVPASMLEVEYFPGEWWDIASAVAADRGPPMNEALLVTDVPREEWLEDKIAYAKKRGRDSFGVPYMGSTTGYVRQPSHVVLPVSTLARIPGARGEQRNIRQDDLKAIMQIMKDTGKLPLTSSGKEYVPFICVAWNGEPWVMEGNHRIMAAERLGWETLPVELKYFDGGERVKSGLLYPGKIGLTAPAPGTSVTMNEETIKLGKTDTSRAREFIDAVYTRYPHTFQNNHVMSWGSGEEQEISMFELVPSFGKPNAVEIKWIQAYPLRKGVGSRAMKELQGMAQEHGVSLTLFPWDKGRVSQAKLMKFYRSHGFQPTVKGAKNMIWHPEVAEASLATMRDYFAGNDKAQDPTKLSVMRKYFDQVDGVSNINRSPGKTGKIPAGIPPEIQALVNKMYHSGKISPQEYEILRRFQQQTKINVMGIKEAETGTAYARDISKEFRKLGYSKIGSGADSTIWAKDASHVIKILMPEDAGSRAVEVFKKFYEFCQARPDIPCLPVFNEYNTIDVLDKEYIQIDMERLYPVKKNTFEEAMIWYLSDYVANGAVWEQVKQELSDPHPWINSHWPSKANKLAQTVQELSSQDESAWNLLYSVMAMLYKTGRINKLGWDLHTENVMRRSNGQLVIIDPWFADASLISESVDVVDENFADGRKPGRKGLAKRMGVDCSKSVTALRKLAAASSGEKQRMAHWCANMKAGKNESVNEGLENVNQMNYLVDLPVIGNKLAKVVNTADNRITVVVNINGVNMPFYISTGEGGKASVPAGKWYPFFGTGPSGWLNKGSEKTINAFYGSGILKSFANLLNLKLGDLRSNEKDIPYIVKSARDIINKDMLDPQNHFGAEDLGEIKKFKNRINSILKRLGDDPFYAVDESLDLAEGGWASTATQNTKITPAIIDEAVGILKEFETEFNQWQAQKGLDVEIKMGRPVGSGTYYKRDLAQDPEREYGDVDVMCYIHGREGTGAARRTAEYAAAVEEFTQGHSKYSTSNGTNVIMDTSAGPVQVDLIYTYHEHANWARMLAPEYRVKGVINTSLVSSLAEVLNLSIGVQGVQVKTRAGRPVSFRQSKDTELATVSLDPENWGADIYAYYYELANGTKPKIPANLSKHGGLKDEQRISDIVLTIKALATDMEQAKLLGAGALDHIANKQDMMQQIARVLDAKFEKVINSSKFDKAATPAAVEKANKTKLMLAKYRNEITKLLLN
jgi:hypothetical protein